MRHLKPYKLFEGIEIYTVNENLLNSYLNELGTSVEELNDVFDGLIDMNYDSSLQLLFLDKNGTRYTSLPDFWVKLLDETREKHPLIPYLYITFEKDSVGKRTIKNANGLNMYQQEVDPIICFSDSISRLKSTYSDREIYWGFKSNKIEVLIYFDAITMDKYETFKEV